VRQHLIGDDESESGGTFSNGTSDIRVVNTSNRCVTWNHTQLHGTGRYKEGLENVRVDILLNEVTQRGWEKYKAKVREGKLPGDDLP